MSQDDRNAVKHLNVVFAWVLCLILQLSRLILYPCSPLNIYHGPWLLAPAYELPVVSAGVRVV